jgi:putative ABC transport system permease protein
VGNVLLFALLTFIPQFVLGLLPRTCHRLLLWLLGDSDREAATLKLGLRVWGGMFLGLIIYAVQYLFFVCLLAAWAHTFPGLTQKLALGGVISSDSGWLDLIPSRAKFQLQIAQLLPYLAGFLVRAPYQRIDKHLRILRGMLWIREQITRIAGFLLLLGFGLLPLTSLLMLLPIIMPQEAILSDTIAPAKTFWRRAGRRIIALVTGMTVFLALLTFSIEIVSWLGFKSPVFGQIARQLLPAGVIQRLPVSLVEAWPFVFLLMYILDFLLLFGIGKVPLQYNFRNLRVRWLTTFMTGVAFTVVVALLILMSSFIDSVRRLTVNTGVPGNIFVLSEGAPDELFSNFNYGGSDKIPLWVVDRDQFNRHLKTPLTVKTLPNKGGEPIRLCSRETYFVINQEIAKPSGTQVRRFVQLRGIENAEIAGKVHDITLLEGEWFGDEGAVTLKTGGTAVPCVVGEGAAAAYGDDVGRGRLKTGDTFKLGDLDMYVSGVMKSAGKTFDSETWAKQNRIGQVFGKQAFTTIVLRVSDENPDTMQHSAEIMAAHMIRNMADPKVKAVTETKYYDDLAKSNADLMFMVTAVALIMALGGIIGVMLVMFAAIAQRIKDVGVMRVVGYKRWQILVSFMLESLAIALIGGLLAVMLILVVDAVATATMGGLSITSSISGGQGSNKTVVTKLVFGFDVFVGGILFTIVMGRLGGLLPSVGAMRLGILESLR